MMRADADVAVAVSAGAARATTQNTYRQAPVSSADTSGVPFPRERNIWTSTDGWGITTRLMVTPISMLISKHRRNGDAKGYNVNLEDVTRATWQYTAPRRKVSKNRRLTLVSTTQKGLSALERFAWYRKVMENKLLLIHTLLALIAFGVVITSAANKEETTYKASVAWMALAFVMAVIQFAHSMYVDSQATFARAHEKALTMQAPAHSGDAGGGAATAAASAPAPVPVAAVATPVPASAGDAGALPSPSAPGEDDDDAGGVYLGDDSDGGDAAAGDASAAAPATATAGAATAAAPPPPPVKSASMDDVDATSAEAAEARARSAAARAGVTVSDKSKYLIAVLLISFGAITACGNGQRLLGIALDVDVPANIDPSCSFEAAKWWATVNCQCFDYEEHCGTVDASDGAGGDAGEGGSGGGAGGGAGGDDDGLPSFDDDASPFRWRRRRLATAAEKNLAYRQCPAGGGTVATSAVQSVCSADESNEDADTCGLCSAGFLPSFRACVWLQLILFIVDVVIIIILPARDPRAVAIANVDRIISNREAKCLLRIHASGDVYEVPVGSEEHAVDALMCINHFAHEQRVAYKGHAAARSNVGGGWFAHKHSGGKGSSAGGGLLQTLFGGAKTGTAGGATKESQ